MLKVLATLRLLRDTTNDIDQAVIAGIGIGQWWPILSGIKIQAEILTKLLGEADVNWISEPLVCKACGLEFIGLHPYTPGKDIYECIRCGKPEAIRRAKEASDGKP